MSDRHIDTFCRRTLKSVLARHYSDYSPEKLKTIYEKANLKVFEEAPTSHKSSVAVIEEPNRRCDVE